MHLRRGRVPEAVEVVLDNDVAGAIRAAVGCLSKTAILANPCKPSEGWNNHLVRVRRGGWIHSYPKRSRVGSWTAADLTHPGQGDGVASPFNPEQAIDAQSDVLPHLRGEDVRDPGDEIDLALAADNAGWSQVPRYGGIPPFPETEAYVERIRDRQSTTDSTGRDQMWCFHSESTEYTR